MDTSTTQPLTKWQARTRNDQRATSRYARRRDIDRIHDELQLAKQLREPLT